MVVVALVETYEYGILYDGGQEENEEVDEIQVDFERRSNDLFRILINNVESLMIIKNLLFRFRFPNKGEGHQICLVMEASDAERKMVSIHSKQHRGHLFLFTVFSRDYYTPQAFKLAYEVVSRCPICAQMKARKKSKSQRMNLTTGELNKWAADIKGPIAVGTSKKYVLACVEVNLRLV